MNLDKREDLITLYEKYKNLLTQNQRQVLHLRLLEDLSLAEIAEILATTRQSVNDAISKGTKKLETINSKIG
ncbi:MAG: hypothetical protein KAG14_00525, partial [Mycoplasmataceae bacterium]|nr:hypothetical protein [Mycoplasmataceae bacterium]